jgi:hypothetical protein
MDIAGFKRYIFMATFTERVRSLTSLVLSSGNTSQDAVDQLKIVGTANAAAANTLQITNASQSAASGVWTIPDLAGATVNAVADTLTQTLTNKTVATLTVDTGTKTATATAGAATLNKNAGAVTSESITTAAGSDYVLTLTNSAISASSFVMVSVANGTNTTEGLAVNRVQPGSGSVVIHIRNTHASAALNGTIVISFVVAN